MNPNAKELLSEPAISTFEAESSAIASWLQQNLEKLGLFRVSEVTRISIYRVTDAHAMRVGLINFLSGKELRPLLKNNFSALQKDIQPYVKNIILGDKFGSFTYVASDVLFMHPGATTSTSFDFDTSKYLADNDGKGILFTLKMHPNIPEAAKTNGGGRVHIIMTLDGNVFYDGLVVPGPPVELRMGSSTGNSIKIAVDNAGVSNANWFLMQINSL